MKITTSEGRNFDITFHYDDNDPKICTKAVIVDLDNDKEESGLALCSAHDTFSKIVGRKIALRIALKNAGYNESVRASIWIALEKRGMRLSPYVPNHLVEAYKEIKRLKEKLAMFEQTQREVA